MRTLFGTLLGAIAVGVLLVAYGLLSPRASANAMDPYQYQSARPMFASNRVTLSDDANTAGNPAWQLRCEPGQRAVIRHVGGATAAECVDGATLDSRYRAAPAALAYPTYSAYPVSGFRQVQPVRAYTSAPAPRRASVATIDRAHRDWAKTAMVIGGSSAAGAGLGAIFGGKKGALIGAAIGGGAGTLYEVKH